MAWRYCGNQIKLWRTRAGVSREELGKEACYEYETVKSMEQGRRKPTLRLLQVADEMCGAHGLLLAAEDYLKPEKYPPRTHDFMAAEETAVALHSYATMFIPGLLQTAAYARFLMGDYCPPLDDETVDERVASRLQRQGKLTSKPPALFNFVIHEAALRSLAGGPEVMGPQLRHLVTIGRLRNVSVQVLRLDSGTTAGLAGPYVLLETAEHEQYAYVEGQETGVLYTDPLKLSRLTQRHGMIRMHALGTEESARFIDKIAEEL
ncbi:helix-turn-helix domain-containing protein [Streptomyces zingiberis]|uniref:Helix-turn-helix domain-containing protein n=1 Tax=Streptomyces zingiberis TaxID=2053010 RepID=A0ABX1BQD0_9ACTN|nr:helix-turn-helix transcriptional regulator [Streptomyces zingiberis]NJP99938.1 helix-turn-helix domain-containing protein [Streptomyces zingiberis]